MNQFAICLHLVIAFHWINISFILEKCNSHWSRGILIKSFSIEFHAKYSALTSSLNPSKSLICLPVCHSSIPHQNNSFESIFYLPSPHAPHPPPRPYLSSTQLTYLPTDSPLSAPISSSTPEIKAKDAARFHWLISEAQLKAREFGEIEKRNRIKWGLFISRFLITTHRRFHDDYMLTFTGRQSSFLPRFLTIFGATFHHHAN